MTTVGILGAAHCGSTALNLALDGLPGVAGVGESHWLLDVDRLGPDQGWTRRDWPCRTCGPDCDVLTREVQSMAHAHQPDWWGWLAGHVFRADHIVSTDKRTVTFDRLGLPDAAIVLYRHPVPWVASWCRRSEERHPLDAVKIWTRLYGATARWCEDRGVRWTAMCWDRVRNAPEEHLPSLCAWLGLPWDPACIDIGARPHHHIGGDAGLARDSITPHDTRWIGELTPEYVATIHRAAGSVLADLQANTRYL